VIFLYLFITFFQIGLFGFGGGYGMLSLIQTETVIRHHWLTTAEFTNIVAISQYDPVPIGHQLGHLLRLYRRTQCRLQQHYGNAGLGHGHLCLGAAPFI
jgi:chromate transport protein ChrA